MLPWFLVLQAPRTTPDLPYFDMLPRPAGARPWPRPGPASASVRAVGRGFPAERAAPGCRDVRLRQARYFTKRAVAGNCEFGKMAGSGRCSRSKGVAAGLIRRKAGFRVFPALPKARFAGLFRRKPSA